MMVPCMVMSARYSSGVITPPAAPCGNIRSSSGIFNVGEARCVRISRDSVIPTRVENKASNRYWMPMTLWSRLRMYLPMKLFRTPCTRVASAIILLLLADVVLAQPLLELFRFEHFQVGPHAVVAQAAQFGAGNLEASNLVGGEVNGNLHARHGVLLQAQLPDKEAVDHVLGS